MGCLIDHFKVGLCKQSIAFLNDRGDEEAWASFGEEGLIREHAVRAALKVLATDHVPIFAEAQGADVTEAAMLSPWICVAGASQSMLTCVSIVRSQRPLRGVPTWLNH